MLANSLSSSGLQKFKFDFQVDNVTGGILDTYLRILVIAYDSELIHRTHWQPDGLQALARQ
jgi:hypothetical protein